MQSARYQGLELGCFASGPALLDHKGDVEPSTQTSAAARSDIVRTLAAWSNSGLTEVLVYGAPNATPAETHC
jgi:hypothetical protein